MVKLKASVSKEYDPDEEGGLNYEQPKPGVYDMHIVEVEEDESGAGNEMLVVVYEVTDGDYKGSRVWDYITFTEKTQWKVDQFFYAIGLEPGSETELEDDDLIGLPVKVRIRADSYEGQYRAKVRQVNRHPDNAGPGASTSTIDVDPDEDEDDEDDEELDEELYEEDELEAMSAAEVKEIAKDEFDIKTKKGMKKADYIAAILEAQDELDEEDEEDDEEEDDEEEEGDLPDPDEVKAMPIADLRELAEELEIDGFDKLKKPTLVKKINAEIDQLSF